MGNSPTVAIILAAGVGSRLRPYTDDRPKCLVPVGDETILSRAVRVLAEHGVSRLVLVTGYLEQHVRAALAHSPLPVTYAPNPAYATTQNVVSLDAGLREVGADESVIKLDGDVVFERSVVDALRGATGGLRVAVDRSGSLGAEEMKVQVAGDRVVAFGKGIEPATAHGESIGIEWIDAAAVGTIARAIGAAVRAGRTGVYYEDVYNDVLGDVTARAVTVDPHAWTEIDDADDLARARAVFGRRS